MISDKSSNHWQPKPEAATDEQKARLLRKNELKKQIRDHEEEELKARDDIRKKLQMDQGGQDAKQE